jgi:hypothetical protein
MKAPTTDTKLYAELEKMFGIGSYDGVGEHFKYVIGEVGKMKRWRTGRNLSIEDLWIAAQFCKAQRLVITEPFQLTKHITAAKRWNAALAQRETRSSLGQRMENAVTRELAIDRGDESGEWIGRLLRAQGDAREEVLAAWERSLPSTSEDPNPTA